MKTITVTSAQFEKLYWTDMNCELPFFQDEWDNPNEATQINLHEDGTLDYDIEGADGVGPYTWSGVTFEELKKEVSRLNDAPKMKTIDKLLHNLGAENTYLLKYGTYENNTMVHL